MRVALVSPPDEDIKRLYRWMVSRLQGGGYNWSLHDSYSDAVEWVGGK